MPRAHARLNYSLSVSTQTQHIFVRKLLCIVSANILGPGASIHPELHLGGGEGQSAPYYSIFSCTKYEADEQRKIFVVPEGDSRTTSVFFLQKMFPLIPLVLRGRFFS